MYIKFIDVPLLYYAHRHVSATHVAIFRVTSLRTRIQILKKKNCPNRSKVFKNHTVSSLNSLLNNNISNHSYFILFNS